MEGIRKTVSLFESKGPFTDNDEKDLLECLRILSIWRRIKKAFFINETGGVMVFYAKNEKGISQIQVTIAYEKEKGGNTRGTRST